MRRSLSVPPRHLKKGSADLDYEGRTRSRRRRPSPRLNLIELAGVVESAHHTTDHPTLWDGNVYRATSFYTCFVVQLGCTTLCKAVVDIFARSKSRWSIRVVSRVLKQSHTQRSRFTPRPTSRHRLMQLWTQPSACRVGRSTCPWSPAEHQVQRVTTNPYPCPTETPARRRH